MQRVRSVVGELGRAVVVKKSHGRVSELAHHHDAAHHAHPVAGRARQTQTAAVRERPRIAREKEQKGSIFFWNYFVVDTVL